MVALQQSVQPDLFIRRQSYPDGIPLEICALFERFALDVAAKGFKRYSADAVCHRLRWHQQVEQGNREFKINDHWTALLARWFLRCYPQYPEFFELRTSQHDALDKRLSR